MSYHDSIFKFVTIRSANFAAKGPQKVKIQPKTKFTQALVEILLSEKEGDEKILAVNQELEAFIKSKQFYRHSSEVTAIYTRLLSESKKGEKVLKKSLKAFYEVIYDNIVFRVVSKSNTVEVFHTLIHTLKDMHKRLYLSEKEEEIDQLQVILPKGLILAVSASRKEAATVSESPTGKPTAIGNEIKDLRGREVELRLQIEESYGKLRDAQSVLLAQQSEVRAMEMPDERMVAPVEERLSKLQQNLAPIESLWNETVSLEGEEAAVRRRLEELYREAASNLPDRVYAYIGENYVEVTGLDQKHPLAEEDAIFVYANACYLKFPFKIADLKVVKQKVVGYLPHEIAHINNTQPGEKNVRETRRLKRIESSESMISEDEITKETDIRSQENFSMEKAASEVQSEENSLNINTSVSGTYGVVTASLDAGFSHSDSTENSNKSSQTYAKEVVQKIVDRVSHKVKLERKIKTVEEFEEKVKHIIDNTHIPDPKSYLYRFLLKIVSATLINYGKRLTFELSVGHASHYYLSRCLKQSGKVNIPQDPREYKDENGLIFSIEQIRRENYTIWESMYNVKLELPPMEYIIVSTSEIKSSTIDIPQGYVAKKAYVAVVMRESEHEQSFELILIIGRKVRIDAHRDNTWSGIWENFVNGYVLDDEVNKVPVAVLNVRGGGLSGSIEIECKASTQLMLEWQTKCYFAIIEAYENLKAEAEHKMSTFNPNNIGLNPSRKKDIILSELKKGAIQKMFRCNPFWVNDAYIVGNEYDPNCCIDNHNAERVRFLETTFDWKNMTYELHPYFYNSHSLNSTDDNWARMLDLTDDDPHFEAFLQASYATVRIPVHREDQKEIAAINFIMNNSIGNYAVLPDDVQHILDDLQQNTPFGYIDETPTNIAFVAIQKEYDKTGKLRYFYKDGDGNEVPCVAVVEYDKEGNMTTFYYDSDSLKRVISEIKEGFNEDGHKYHYYFNAANEKIITHRSKMETDIEGNRIPYYSIDLGIFQIPTDLVILEAGVQNGVEVRGYPENSNPPSSDILIPKQYSPAIIQK